MRGIDRRAQAAHRRAERAALENDPTDYRSFVPRPLGAELLTGELPADVRGMSRIVRNGDRIWEKPFLTGEANMLHAIRNLEHHHFKYRLFRQPGDVHVHMFGTATLSFADGIRTEAGDVFEIEAPDFGLPLRNALKLADAEEVAVRAL